MCSVAVSARGSELGRGRWWKPVCTKYKGDLLSVCFYPKLSSAKSAVHKGSVRRTRLVQKNAEALPERIRKRTTRIWFSQPQPHCSCLCWALRVHACAKYFIQDVCMLSTPTLFRVFWFLRQDFRNVHHTKANAKAFADVFFWLQFSQFRLRQMISTRESSASLASQKFKVAENCIKLLLQPHAGLPQSASHAGCQPSTLSDGRTE